MRAGRRTFFSVVRDDSKSVSLVPNMATVPGHVSRPEDSVQCLLEGGARCRTHLKANSVSTSCHEDDASISKDDATGISEDDGKHSA